LGNQRQTGVFVVMDHLPQEVARVALFLDKVSQQADAYACEA
jgi:hypothetical protein